MQYVIAELETDRGTVHMNITDRRTSSDGGNSGNDGADENRRDDTGTRTTSVPSELTCQGPLRSNGMRHLGSFEYLTERLLTRDGRDEPFASRGDDGTWRLTVRLIASYAPEDGPIGAERTFRISSSAGGPTGRAGDVAHAPTLLSQRAARAAGAFLRSLADAVWVAHILEYG